VPRLFPNRRRCFNSFYGHGPVSANRETVPETGECKVLNEVGEQRKRVIVSAKRAERQEGFCDGTAFGEFPVEELEMVLEAEAEAAEAAEAAAAALAPALAAEAFTASPF